jgi:hypothetical protein
MAVIRMYFEGQSWLGASTKNNVRTAVGAWECGCSTGTNGYYVTKVWEYLAAKPWKTPKQPPYYF